jgi:hypothetical protein
MDHSIRVSLQIFTQEFILKCFDEETLDQKVKIRFVMSFREDLPYSFLELI